MCTYIGVQKYMWVHIYMYIYIHTHLHILVGISVVERIIPLFRKG